MTSQANPTVDVQQPAIETQESMSGFIASEPKLTYTADGDARLYVKVGQEHRQLEPDGSYTKLKTTFHDLVAFRGAAEHGYQQLAKRDYFIAEGHIHQYVSPKTGRQEEQFIATRLGHDLARTHYSVQRGRRARGVERDVAEFETAERRATANVSPISM